MDDQIKLVVYGEYLLGYILPILPRYVCVLHWSILKGAPYLNTTNEAAFINPRKSLRLACKEDFEDFRCSFEGYGRDASYLFSKEDNRPKSQLDHELSSNN